VTCQKEHENHVYLLTTHQYQILTDVLRQNNSDRAANPVQVNQVDLFFVDYKAHEQSSTGKNTFTSL